MSRYRARHCPNCDYYIGFSVVTHAARTGQTPITNFCLNCNYKLPMHSIVHGVRRAPRSSWRSNLHLVQGTTPSPADAGEAHSPHLTMDTSIRPDDYARHLRTIGQDLENIHLVAFNLECTGEAYLVWVRSENANDSSNPLVRGGKNRLQKLWRNTLHGRAVAREETFTGLAFADRQAFALLIDGPGAPGARTAWPTAATDAHSRRTFHLSTAAHDRRYGWPKRGTSPGGFPGKS